MAMMIAAMMLAGAASAPGSGEREWLALPSVPDFTVAYREERGPLRMVERVRRGESVESWSRMITEQSVAGMASTGAEAFLSKLAGLWAAACPGAESSPTTSHSGDTGIVATLRADCPMNPNTGKPETLFAAATTSGDTLYVAQIAFRRRPTAEDKAWAEDMLSGLTICRPGSAKAVCQDQ